MAPGDERPSTPQGRHTGPDAGQVSWLRQMRQQRAIRVAIHTSDSYGLLLALLVIDYFLVSAVGSWG